MDRPLELPQNAPLAVRRIPMNLVKSLACIASLSLVASAIVACGAPNGQDGVGSGAQAVERDLLDAEPDSFTCGTDPTPCDRTTQYCQRDIGGIPGRVLYKCENFPARCVADGELSCACFTHSPATSSCAVLPGGGTVLTQRVP
jgi:hypothetical protein